MGVGGCPGGGGPAPGGSRARASCGCRDPPPAAPRAATSSGGCVRGGGRGGRAGGAGKWRPGSGRSRQVRGVPVSGARQLPFAGLGGGRQGGSELSAPLPPGDPAWPRGGTWVSLRRLDSAWASAPAQPVWVSRQRDGGLLPPPAPPPPLAQLPLQRRARRRGCRRRGRRGPLAAAPAEGTRPRCAAWGRACALPGRRLAQAPGDGAGGAAVLWTSLPGTGLRGPGT